MKPGITAIRAISAEFARRLFMPIVFITIPILVVALVGAGWLTTQSAWWWILLTLLIIAALVSVGVMTIAFVVIRVVRPRQTAAQHRGVIGLVDEFETVSEIIQTPKFIIMIRLLRDIIFPRDSSYIDEVTLHATRLRPTFETVIASFRDTVA